MVKEKIDIVKLGTINLGIVGHIDHGKTTLLQRLSGKWTDTHSEELKRGITIKLGYADAVISEDKGVYNIEGLGTPVRHVSFVDAPGHEMLMATMLSGAAMMDAAILVVAANEGIKPQTREHLMALKAKRVGNLIVVQNKIDLVDEKDAEKNYHEIQELLKEGFGNIPVIPVSAQQGVNVEKIFEAIAGLEIPKRDESGEPRFVVARSFDINSPGRKPSELNGAVLGGTLKQGSLKIGDEIEIKPGRLIKEESGYRHEPLKTKIRALFIGSEQVSELSPGGSMSIETELDMSLAKSDGLSGNVVSLPGKLPEVSKKVKIKYELFKEVFGLGAHKKVDELNKGEVMMLSVNTSTSGGSVASIGKGEFEIDLKVPVIVQKGDNVGIARNMAGHWRLIGYGEIL
jgi:translation initiation factor 2 subunit 3